MLGMAREVSFLETMADLHLLPVAISYEFDPCDMMKAREIYLTQAHGSYEKAPLEDLQSMKMGILGFKGRVHVSFGSELTGEALSEAQSLNKRDQVQWLADRLDAEIHRIFRNWPSHYIAYDLLHEGNEMRSYYTEQEKGAFLQRLEKQSQYLLS